MAEWRGISKTRTSRSQKLFAESGHRQKLYNPLVNVTYLDLVLKKEAFTKKKPFFFREFVRETDSRGWFSLKGFKNGSNLEEGWYNLLE